MYTLLWEAQKDPNREEAKEEENNSINILCLLFGVCQTVASSRILNIEMKKRQEPGSPHCLCEMPAQNKWSNKPLFQYFSSINSHYLSWPGFESKASREWGWQRVWLKLWKGSAVPISGFFISVFVCPFIPAAADRVDGLQCSSHLILHAAIPRWANVYNKAARLEENVRQDQCATDGFHALDFSTCGAFMAYEHDTGWWNYRQQCWMCLQNWRGSHVHDSSVICCCQFPVVLNTSAQRWSLNNEWLKFECALSCSSWQLQPCVVFQVAPLVPLACKHMISTGIKCYFLSCIFLLNELKLCKKLN